MSKHITKAYIEIVYSDGTEFGFNVELTSDEPGTSAEIMMITRGTLMASNGMRATAYDDQGFDICSYIK